MTDLDTALQQNAAMVEESAAASENLKEQAVFLTHQIHNFHLTRDEPGYTKLGDGTSTSSHRTSNTPLFGR